MDPQNFIIKIFSLFFLISEFSVKIFHELVKNIYVKYIMYNRKIKISYCECKTLIHTQTFDKRGRLKHKIRFD